MRALAILAVLVSFAVRAGVEVVDLDAPGALAALMRDKPDHYAQVRRAMEDIQAVPDNPTGRRNLFLDERTPDPTRRQVETSQPAKTRLTVPVGEVNYRITVRYLRNPATVQPAK
jgi:hypothetical protein